MKKQLNKSAIFTHKRQSLNAFLKSLMVFLFIASFCFVGCEKEVVTELDSVNQEAPLVLPKTKLKNGILYFNSIKEAQEAYEIINTRISQNTNENTLKNIERELGHKSLLFTEKQHTNTLKSDDEEEFTEEEILQGIADDFINDDVRKLLLNQYYEIGIDNDVYVFLSKDKEIVILDSHQPSVDAFRMTEKGEDELPYELFNEKVRFESNSGSFYSKKTGTESTTAGCEEEIIPQTGFNNVNCEVFSKRFIGILSISKLYDNETTDTADDYCQMEEYEGDISIDFGDGNTQNFNNVSSFELTHNYANTGSYNVIITFEYIDLDGEQVSDEFEILVQVSNTCTDQETDLTDWQEDAVRAMSSKLWFKTDFFGSHAGAFTHGYRLKESSEKWVREKGALDVSIDATFLNNNCNDETSKSKTDDCDNCKKKRATVHDWFDKRDLQNGDIFSSHSANFDNGSSFSLEMVLNPCE